MNECDVRNLAQRDGVKCWRSRVKDNRAPSEVTT